MGIDGNSTFGRRWRLPVVELLEPRAYDFVDPFHVALEDPAPIKALHRRRRHHTRKPARERVEGRSARALATLLVDGL